MTYIHCQLELISNTNPLVSTYCMRPRGHEGRCDPALQPGDLDPASLAQAAVKTAAAPSLFPPLTNGGQSQ